MNKEWHLKNLVPKDKKSETYLQWHVNHTRECGCRKMPQKVIERLKLRRPKLIVGVLMQNKNKYLLVRETLEGGKDYWIIPGGKVEFGESLENAAKREIEEETGLKPKKLELLTFWEALFPDYNYHTVIFFYKGKSNTFELAEDIEGKVKEAKWFTKTEIKKLKLVESAQWLFDWMKKN